MLPELEKILPDMTVAEMVNRNQASLDTLRHLLKQNPSIRVSDILTPSPDSHEAEVRGVMFDIFHRVGKVMGRNSE